MPLHLMLILTHLSIYECRNTSVSFIMSGRHESMQASRWREFLSVHQTTIRAVHMAWLYRKNVLVWCFVLASLLSRKVLDATCVLYGRLGIAADRDPRSALLTITITRRLCTPTRPGRLRQNSLCSLTKFQQPCRHRRPLARRAENRCRRISSRRWC